MNNKITLSAISQILAEKTGLSRKDCEGVLKSMFANIASSLEVGEQIRIKGFGTFKISKVESRRSVDVTSGNDYEIPAHRKVVFIPAKELAQAVNAPFEMFETIELEESVLEEELLQTESESDPMAVVNPSMDIEGELMLEKEKKEELEDRYPVLKDEDGKESDKEEDKDNSKDSEMSASDEEGQEPEPDAEKVDEPDSEPESMSGSESESSESESSESDSEQCEGSVKESVAESTPVDFYADEENISNNADEKQGRRRSFGHGFLWGIIAALFFVIVVAGVIYFCGLMPQQNDKVLPEEISKNDSVNAAGKELASGAAVENSEVEILDAAENDVEEEAAGVDVGPEDIAADKVVPTRPSDQVVYDTISKTRYLTTMAKKHYGNYHLWPYIYKENEKFLGHPDRIRPGTRVVIPKLSKYGVDPSDKKDIEKAKRMGTEIYSRYR